jgi:hypothetical protein
MLPNMIRNQGRYKYSLILNDWEYLDKHLGWSEV